MSQTVFLALSWTHVLVDLIVYVPSVSHVPVPATPGQTLLASGRMSNAILIGGVSGAAAVLCIMGGAIVFVTRTKRKENASNGDGEPAAPAECNCDDSSEAVEQPDSQLGIDQRYSCDQTPTTCDITRLAEHDEVLFI
jgi:hypothetical protein